MVKQDFRKADGEHRARLGDYEQVHNEREDRAPKGLWFRA